MADYGADKMGYPVTSLEALRRAQRFPISGTARAMENIDELGMGFTLAEYAQAVGENVVFDMAMRRGRRGEPE
jgi:hypothetical protein